MMHKSSRLVVLCFAVSALALAIPSTFNPEPVKAIPAPANDDFPGTVVPGGTALADTVSIRPVGTGDGFTADPNDADTETGEPTASLGSPCSSVNSTVRYTTTAPANGYYLIRTDNAYTNYDTVVRVFTGAAVGALTLIPAGACCPRVMGDSCDDDSGLGLQSMLVFCATAGTTYRIQVGDFGSSPPIVGARLTISIRFSRC